MSSGERIEQLFTRSTVTYPVARSCAVPTRHSASFTPVVSIVWMFRMRLGGMADPADPGGLSRHPSVETSFGFELFGAEREPATARVPVSGTNPFARMSYIEIGCTS